MDGFTKAMSRYFPIVNLIDALEALGLTTTEIEQVTDLVVKIVNEKKEEEDNV